MPTPFSHLRITHRLLQDAQIPDNLRELLCAYQADFLLGGVIADARPTSQSSRADTHFYDYRKPMPDNPWREMFRQYPALKRADQTAQCVFLMGYVAHLASDEYWSRYMLKPHFANGTWGESMPDRFFVLHLLLIYMDERDERALPDVTPAILRRSEPRRWLPFMPDATIRDWRDFIADQLVGHSETLQIFGSRINTEPAELRRMLDDDGLMQRRLWRHITPQMLTDLEEKLYQFSCQQMLTYIAEFVPDLA